MQNGHLQYALRWVRANVWTTVTLAVAAIVVGVSAVMGTLSYPLIMAERQQQINEYCGRRGNVFSSGSYGFTVTAPEGFCFLPNRLFPEDGTVHVLPAGKYSVFAEYASGAIISAAQSTMLFEPIVAGRNPSAVLDALRKGGFLEGATVSEFDNPYAVHITVARNVKGIDSTRRFTWAFLTHPKENTFVSILNAHPENEKVFLELLNTIAPQ